MRPVLAALLALSCSLLMPAAPAAAEDAVLNAKTPTDGVLFGGQPTEEQLRSLAAEGYKTVIDLRGAAEDRGFDEAGVAGELGLDYRHIEVTGETLPEGTPYDEFLALFDEVEKPVLVHCASGNRVGGLYYVYLVAEKNMSREDALAEAKAQGLRSDRLIAPADRYLDSKQQ